MSEWDEEYSGSDDPENFWYYSDDENCFLINGMNKTAEDIIDEFYEFTKYYEKADEYFNKLTDNSDDFQLSVEDLAGIYGLEDIIENIRDYEDEFIPNDYGEPNFFNIK